MTNQDTTTVFEIYEQVLRDIQVRVVEFIGEHENENKRELARELLAIHRRLEFIETATKEFKSLLNQFSETTQVGMRVHYVHKMASPLSMFSTFAHFPGGFSNLQPQALVPSAGLPGIEQNGPATPICGGQFRKLDQK
jgi:hypothetical protein